MVFVHSIVNFFDSFHSIQLHEELFLKPGCPNNLASLIVLNLTERVPPSKLQHLPNKRCVVCFPHTKFDQWRWWLLFILELKRIRNSGMRKKEKTENLKTQAGIGIPKPSVTEVKIV